MLAQNSKTILPFHVILHNVHFTKLFPETFQQYAHTGNNFKYLTQSVHIAKCFGGGHYHHQGIQTVS